MKRTNFLARVLLPVLLLACMAAPVHADTGPKPSVTVAVEGLNGRECYATLLSAVQSTGPHSSRWKIDPYGERYLDPSYTSRFTEDDSEYPAYCAFLDYEENDPEGLFFLGAYSFASVTDTEPYRWGYYPPKSFKVLLYFPETESFAVTGELVERYAFDSYFTVDLSGVELTAGGTVSGLTAARSYNYTAELTGFAARAVLTVAVEIVLALLFKFSTKRQLLLILLVNLVTQTGLNLGLNWFAYHNGAKSIAIPYLMMELAVVLVEFAAYRLWMTDIPKEKRAGRVALYACVANVVSYLAGTALIKVFPLVF